MPNEIIETLCIGGHNDGRRVPCEGRQREKYIRLPVLVNIAARDTFSGHSVMEYEVYRLEQIYGRVSTHWLYLAQPMQIDEAVQMLVDKYRQGETTT
jgi:hypothetical protein